VKRQGRPGNGRCLGGGRRGVEQQEHAAAAAEEDVSIRLAAVDCQAENTDVEPLGGVEIVDVKHRFQDGFWVHDCRRCVRLNHRGTEDEEEFTQKRKKIQFSLCPLCLGVLCGRSVAPPFKQTLPLGQRHAQADAPLLAGPLVPVDTAWR
jgi:hypothetical protein